MVQIAAAPSPVSCPLSALRCQERLWIEAALQRHAAETPALRDGLETRTPPSELLLQGVRALLLARWACWREELLDYLGRGSTVSYDHRQAKRGLLEQLSELAACLLQDPHGWLEVPLQAVLHPVDDFDVWTALSPRAAEACDACHLAERLRGADSAALQQILAGLDVRDTSPDASWRERYWACNGWG